MPALPFLNGLGIHTQWVGTYIGMGGIVLTATSSCLNTRVGLAPGS